MASSEKPNRFSDDQKRECCLMISIGCDRETACNYLGKTAEELRGALRLDEVFRRQLLRAEATPEFNHMRNLYNAAKDEKHWRASVWWLERRAPERYARRAPDALTAPQLRQVIEELAETIVGEVDDPQDRQRLLARLVQIAEKTRNDSFECSSENRSGSVPSKMLKIEQDLDSESTEV